MKAIMRKTLGIILFFVMACSLIPALPGLKAYAVYLDDAGANISCEYDSGRKRLSLHLKDQSLFNNKMYDFSEYLTDRPWADLAGEIEEIWIESGITYIGMHAFEGCEKLDTIWYPASCTEVGQDAFYHCNVHLNMYYRGTFDQWDALTGESSHIPGSRMETIIMSVSCYDYGASGIADLDIELNEPRTWLGKETRGTSVESPAQARALLAVLNDKEEKGEITRKGSDPLGYDLDQDGSLDLIVDNAGTSLSNVNLYVVPDRKADGLFWGVGENVPVSVQEELYDRGEIPYVTVYLNFPKDINKCRVSSIPEKTYKGSQFKPSVTVKDGIWALKKGDDYTLSYGANTNVGMGTVTIKGAGLYEGKKTVRFLINPVGTGMKSASGLKRGFRAVWKKQALKMKTSRITGYQIQYSTSVKFKSAKTVTVKGYAKTAKTVTGLRAGKKYYVRVRTYKTISSRKYCSEWSKPKAVVTRVR